MKNRHFGGSNLKQDTHFARGHRGALQLDPAQSPGPALGPGDQAAASGSVGAYGDLYAAPRGWLAGHGQIIRLNEVPITWYFGGNWGLEPQLLLKPKWPRQPLMSTN